MKARIVRDSYSGFEVQFKRYWWSPWMQGYPNTHSTIEAARRYAQGRMQEVVEYVDPPKRTAGGWCEVCGPFSCACKKG